MSNEHPAVDVWILDRQHRDCEGCMFVLRRIIAEEFGKGFARWAASPESGRFLILPFNTSLQETACFTDDANELVELLKAMGDRTRKALGRTLEVGHLLPPDLESRLRSASVKC
jgi:hypothetical protein